MNDLPKVVVGKPSLSPSSITIELESKLMSSRASILIYLTNPVLIRKLSEGDGGMIKLTDGINVRQKLHP